jgi:hypothetical protein
MAAVIAPSYAWKRAVPKSTPQLRMSPAANAACGGFFRAPTMKLKRSWAYFF